MIRISLTASGFCCDYPEGNEVTLPWCNSIEWADNGKTYRSPSTMIWGQFIENFSLSSPFQPGGRARQGQGSFWSLTSTQARKCFAFTISRWLPGCSGSWVGVWKGFGVWCPRLKTQIPLGSCQRWFGKPRHLEPRWFRSVVWSREALWSSEDPDFGAWRVQVSKFSWFSWPCEYRL